MNTEKLTKFMKDAGIRAKKFLLLKKDESEISESNQLSDGLDTSEAPDDYNEDEWETMRRNKEKDAAEKLESNRTSNQLKIIIALIIYTWAKNGIEKKHTEKQKIKVAKNFYNNLIKDQNIQDTTFKLQIAQTIALHLTQCKTIEEFIEVKSSIENTISAIEKEKKEDTDKEKTLASLEKMENEEKKYLAEIIKEDDSLKEFYDALFFETTFSVSANKDSSPKKISIFDDTNLLQQRLIGRFSENSDSQTICLTRSLYFWENQRDGKNDTMSRTVRIYSFPALFGGTNAQGNKYESVLIKALSNLLKINPKIINKINNSEGLTEQELNDLKELSSKAFNEKDKDVALTMFGKTFGNYLNHKKLKKEGWDKFFNQQIKLIEKTYSNKIRKNTIDLLYKLLIAIENGDWKYKDKNGKEQYNDFLITATDETSDKPYVVPIFNFHWGTKPNLDRAPVSVKFVNSKDNLYKLTDNVKKQADKKFKEIRSYLLKIGK